MKIITKLAPKSRRGKDLTVVWGLHQTRWGKLLIAQTAEGICWLGFGDASKRLFSDFPGANFIEDEKVTSKAAKEVEKRWPKSMEELSFPIVLYGTAFQLKVWKELLKIKCGATTTYSAIARKVGADAAHRAVGTAVGKNPISIVVPCHRVINKTGGRVNYAWGPEVKLGLLKGEGVSL